MRKQTVQLTVNIDKEEYDEVLAFIEEFNHSGAAQKAKKCLSMERFASYAFSLLASHRQEFAMGLKLDFVGEKVELVVGVIEKEEESDSASQQRIQELEEELKAIKSLLSGGNDVHPLAADLPPPTEDEIRHLFRGLAA